MDNQTTKDIIDLLGAMINDINSAKDAITEGFKKVDDNFKEVHKRIDDLSGNTTSDFKDVKFELKTIQDEITKIGNATGYVDLYNSLKDHNLKIIQGGK